jgi:hypothetical protein
MKYFVTVVVLFSIFKGLNCQDLENISEQKPLSISGSVNTTSNLYFTSDTNSIREPFSYLLTGNFNLSVYGIHMPFSFMYSNQNFNYAQPFNRIGFSPQYKWIKLHLGYRTVTHSSFTLADHSFLGAGIELNPGKFRYSSVYGRFKKKTIPNTVNPLDTLFSPTRKGYSVKVGYGSDRNYFDIIFLKIADDTITNLESATENYEPSQDNMILGAQFKFSFAKNLNWETEAAISLLTKDTGLNTNLDSIGKLLTKVNSFFIINESSEYSTAFRSNLQYTYKSINVGLQYRRIAPNYQSFGAYYFNTDIENITLNSSFRVFKKKLSLRGSIGIQNDNLMNNKARNSRRLITRAVFDYNSGKVFGINGTYSNYSINQFAGNLPLNDTIKLYQSNRNFSLMPRLTFIGDNIVQMVQVNISYMDLIDHNQFTAENSQISSYIYMLNYIRNYQTIGLSLNTGINRTNMSTSLENRKMTGFSISLGKMLLKNKFNINLTLVNNINRVISETTEYKGKIFTQGISAYYKPHNNHMLKSNVYFNKVKYPEESSGKSYSESKIILSYVYTFR